MKCLALFALLLTPALTLADDCDEGSSPVRVIVVDSPPEPPAPPEPPWSRPPDEDEASQEFRHGHGLGAKIKDRVYRSIREHRIAMPTWNARAGLKTIEGELSANSERAVASARQKLAEAVGDWVSPEVPRSWTIPSRFVDAIPAGTPKTEAIDREYGRVYQASLLCDFSPARRAEIVKAYESTVVAHRLTVLGGILFFVLSCLASLAGYIRADEATKGYYTNRLRMVAAAAVGGAGVLAYQMLT